VNAPFSSLGEAKVLDGIGDVDILSGDPSFLERILKQPSGRAHEGDALAIFDIAGLFSDESERCPRVPSRENHLGCGLPQLATLAVHCRFFEALDVDVLGHPGCRRFGQSRLSVPDRAGPRTRLVIVPPPFEFDHVNHCVDQCQVGEGLWEVAQLLAAMRVDLLRVEIKRAGKGQQLRAQLAGALVLTDLT